MPTPANPESNQYRCKSCGRHLNSKDALTAHEAECSAAKATGSGNMETDQGKLEDGPDREWVSTP